MFIYYYFFIDEDYFVSKDDIDMLYNVPYFKDFSDEVFSQLMKTATLQTFDEGAIVMRQGMPGRKFYVIQDGEVEVAIRSEYEDPLSTPSRYLGAVYNTVGKGNWFGERALITGENRAASLKTTRVTKCFVFNQENIPETSVLSGKLQASEERIAQLNEKYGTIDVTKSIDSKLKESRYENYFTFATSCASSILIYFLLSAVLHHKQGAVSTHRGLLLVLISKKEKLKKLKKVTTQWTQNVERFSRSFADSNLFKW